MENFADLYGEWIYVCEKKKKFKKKIDPANKAQTTKPGEKFVLSIVPLSSFRLALFPSKKKGALNPLIPPR